MSKVLKGIRFFLRADWQLRKNILYIIWLSVKVTLMVRYIPLRCYFNRYFIQPKNTEIDLQPFRGEISFVRRTLRHLPWQYSCLMESLTMKEYLFQHGVNLPVILGVRNADQLAAHAWYGFAGTNGFSVLSKKVVNEA